MTTVYLCGNIFCRYNEDGRCEADEIELDDQGVCLAQFEE